MNSSYFIDVQWIKSNGITYQDYYNRISQFAKDNTTSGNDVSEEKIELTKLNYHRMKRLNDSSLEIEPINLALPIAASIITEAWCGDSAQNIPWIEQFIATIQPKIETHYFFRDENTDLMNLFLTNGSRSIPICIFYNSDNGEVLGKWGPRPQAIAGWLKEYRFNHPAISKHEWEIELHKKYTQNKGNAIIHDLQLILKSIT